VIFIKIGNVGKKITSKNKELQKFEEILDLGLNEYGY